jgi:hypothetical protein
MKKKTYVPNPSGVALWTTHPPWDQKTRVRNSQRCRDFRYNIATLLYTYIDLKCIVCVLKQINIGKNRLIAIQYLHKTHESM